MDAGRAAPAISPDKELMSPGLGPLGRSSSVWNAPPRLPLIAASRAHGARSKVFVGGEAAAKTAVAGGVLATQ